MAQLDFEGPLCLYDDLLYDVALKLSVPTRTILGILTLYLIIKNKSLVVFYDNPFFYIGWIYLVFLYKRSMMACQIILLK